MPCEYNNNILNRHNVFTLALLLTYTRLKLRKIKKIFRYIIIKRPNFNHVQILNSTLRKENLHSKNLALAFFGNKNQ